MDVHQPDNAAESQSSGIRLPRVSSAFSMFPATSRSFLECDQQPVIERRANLVVCLFVGSFDTTVADRLFFTASNVGWLDDVPTPGSPCFLAGKSRYWSQLHYWKMQILLSRSPFYCVVPYLAAARFRWMINAWDGISGGWRLLFWASFRSTSTQAITKRRRRTWIFPSSTRWWGRSLFHWPPGVCLTAAAAGSPTQSQRWHWMRNSYRIGTEHNFGSATRRRPPRSISSGSTKVTSSIETWPLQVQSRCLVELKHNPRAGPDSSTMFVCEGKQSLNLGCENSRRKGNENEKMLKLEKIKKT